MSIFSKRNAVLNQCHEYCKDPYNFQLKTSAGILQIRQVRDSEPEDLPVLREKVERAAHSLKGEKAPGIDNEPAELFNQSSKEITKAVQKSLGMQ